MIELSPNDVAALESLNASDGLPAFVVYYAGTASTRVKDSDRGPDNAYIQGVWRILRREADYAFLAAVGKPYTSVPTEATHVIRGLE